MTPEQNRPAKSFTDTGINTVKSGIYTPVASEEAGIDDIAVNNFSFTRIGRTVVVSGTVTVDPTEASESSFELSVPETIGTLIAATAYSTDGDVATVTKSVDGKTVEIEMGEIAQSDWFISITYIAEL